MKVHITTNLSSLIPFPQPAISILPHWRALTTEQHHPTALYPSSWWSMAMLISVSLSPFLPTISALLSQSPVFLNRGSIAKLAQPSCLLCRKVETKGQSKSPAYSSMPCLFKNIWIVGIVSSLKWLLHRHWNRLPMEVV